MDALIISSLVLCVLISNLYPTVETDLYVYFDNLLCCYNIIFICGGCRSPLWFLLIQIARFREVLHTSRYHFFWWRHPQTVLHFKASLCFHVDFYMSEVRSCNIDEQLFSCPKHFVANPGTGKNFISSWTFIPLPYHVCSLIE